MMYATHLPQINFSFSISQHPHQSFLIHSHVQTCYSSIIFKASRRRRRIENPHSLNLKLGSPRPFVTRVGSRSDSGGAFDDSTPQKVSDDTSNATHVKFTCEKGSAIAETEDANGSNTPIKWVQRIYQLAINNKAIKSGLWKSLSEIMSPMAILYYPFKNVGPPLHVMLTQSRVSTKPKIKLTDVEGVDAAKAELHEGLRILQRDDKYMKRGVRLPKGYLLVGDPGTGKTLLAEAVAGEAAAGISFFSVFGSQYAGVGEGATGIKDLFREAREKEPSIVFIDQIEAIGKPFGSGTTSDDRLHPALRQLFNEITKNDKDRSMILVIAATNKPKGLDWKLMGYNEFFKRVSVDKPDEDGRRKIFSLHMRDSFMEDKEAICDLVATLTRGFHGADLKDVSYDSRRFAARRGHEHVTRDDILDAIASVRSQNYDDPEAKPPYSYEPREIAITQLNYTIKKD